MQNINPRGLTGDDLGRHFRIALATRDEMKDAAEAGEDIILDLSDAEWFTPSFLAPICVSYNQAVDSGVNVDTVYPNRPLVERYLRQIRFPSGTTDPSAYRNNLPICLMNAGIDENIIELVGKEIRRLLRKQVLDDLELENVNWLQIPISELVDNVEIHSNCDYGALIVQNYPKKGFLDICIVDDGISIPGSYERHGVAFDGDREALTMAMIDGISTRNPQNRGHGLRTVAKMVCEGLGGRAFLSSGGATLYRLGNQRSDPQFRDRSWDGTVFAGRLPTPESDFNYLDYITTD